MQENKLEDFTTELLTILKEQINDSMKGYIGIGTNYWTGRLFNSYELDEKIKRLIDRYKE